MAVQWRIERSGRAWQAGEAMARWELTPERLEMIEGKLLFDEESRVALLGLLLENTGADAAVHLGDPAVWIEAIDALRHERDSGSYAAIADPELPVGAETLDGEQRLCASLLGRLMSDLSQDFWCAGWLRDLEFELWSALAGEKSWVGEAAVTQLRYLSDRCRGWVVFHEGAPYRRYVPIADWMREYDLWRLRPKEQEEE